MTTYLVSMCARDGSTPLGECPEVEIEVEPQPGLNAYQNALLAFSNQYPDHDIVSWGEKNEVLAWREQQAKGY